MAETVTETDTEAEPEMVELKVAGTDEPKRRLSISVEGRGVEVEGPDDLADLVAVATELWKLTGRPPARPAGFGATTLYTEIVARNDQTDQGDG